MKPLEGHVVVVTGAGRGLGRAYAIDAAAAGASVVVNDVDLEEAQSVAAALPAAVASGHDVGTSAASLIELAVETFGRLDGLVNNAGLYHEAAPWDEDPERMRRLVEVNVLGPLACTAAAARAFRRQGTGGSIVNATSGALFGFPELATYGASKGAVASMTLASAHDLASIGVRVNAVAPIAATRLTLAAEVGKRYVPSGAARAPLEGIESRTPDRLAPLVTFLLSPLSQGTGRLYRFDGTRLSRLELGDPGGTAVVRRDSWDLSAVATAFAELDL